MSETPATQPAPWQFEPCDPEGERDSHGRPLHAVRGVRPTKGFRAVVTGYGLTEDAATEKAQQAAREYDAREVLNDAARSTS